MPRRSTRIKQNAEQKDIEIVDDQPSKTELTSVQIIKNNTNSKKTESVSNDNEMSLSPPDQNAEEKEQKQQNKARMSVDVDEKEQSQESSVDLPSKALVLYISSHSIFFQL